MVESARKRKGPRQRLILNLGKPDIPKEKYKELANCIEAIPSGQMQLPCLDPTLEKHAKKAARSILEKSSRDAAMTKCRKRILKAMGRVCNISISIHLRRLFPDLSGRNMYATVYGRSSGSVSVKIVVAYFDRHRNSRPRIPADMRVIFKDDDRGFKVEVKRRRQEKETWLLCRSTGRLQKDRGIRGRQESLFLENLVSARDGLKKKGCTKRYDKVLEKIGGLRQKYPKASKVYKVAVTADGDQLNTKTKAADIVWENRDLYDAQVKYEVWYGLRTDRVELSDEQVWKTYVMLTLIERAFRCLKTTLGVRPVFHQLEERSDSHLFISVLACRILHTIEYRLRMQGDHRFWDTIRRILSTHQRLTILYDYKEKEIIRHGNMRLCSLPEKEHKIIYHRLGLSDLSLERRYIIENR